jgi:hypothetical protein
MQVESGLVGVEESLAALAKFVDSEERALQDVVEYILRQMCNYVKQNGPWKDHTSNLRNSISINMETMTEWPAGTPEEVLKSLVSKNETPVIEIQGDDYFGCLSAGMEYAVWVELKDGYWVLQGAIDKFEPLMEKYFADKMQVDKLDLIAAADIQYSKYLTRKGLSESEITSRIQAKHDYYNGR